MADCLVTYYPVSNGDTTLISLENGKNILIDCKIRDGETDSKGFKIFDVKEDLLSKLPKKDDVPYVDLFILTHADQDHCLGFEKHFNTGKHSDYSDEDKQLIAIDEIWCTSMIFKNDLCNDAKVIRREAKRRRKLYTDDNSSKEDFGNKITLIGYDGNEKYEDVPFKVPSDIVKMSDCCDFFIHAPFKDDLITSHAENNRNSSSIVIQGRFKENSWDSFPNSFVMFGGDADHYIWEKILDKSKSNDNEDYLKWDLMLAPHHCSWTFWNDVPYGEKEENKEPKDYSIEFISTYRETGAKVVSSSKKIEDNDDNPPHFKSAEEYRKHLDSDSNLIELSPESEEDDPEPLSFKMTKNGPQKKSIAKKVKNSISSGGGAGAVNSIVKNG